MSVHPLEDLIQWQIIAKQTEVAENPKSKHKLKN